MKSALRLALVTASISLAFIGSAFAQCFTPSDIGASFYQIQAVNAYREGDKYTLQLDVVNLMCVESYGSYRWQPRNALDPVTRRAMDGSLYTVTTLSADAVLTTEGYTPIKTLVIENNEFQSFVYKFSVKEVFGASHTVRVRYFQRYLQDITHKGKTTRHTPVAGGETYIDISK